MIISESCTRSPKVTIQQYAQTILTYERLALSKQGTESFYLCFRKVIRLFCLEFKFNSRIIAIVLLDLRICVNYKH